MNTSKKWRKPLFRQPKGEAGGEASGLSLSLSKNPPGVRGPQPPEAIIGFGGVYGKSAKSLA